MGFGDDGTFFYSLINQYGLVACAPGELPNYNNDLVLEPGNVRVSDWQSHGWPKISYYNLNERRIKTHGFEIDTRTTVPFIGNLRLFKAWGWDWLFYQEFEGRGRTVTHPVGNLDGYVLQEGGNVFRPDISPNGDRFVWATKDTDWPHDILLSTVDYSAPRENLGSAQPTEPMGEVMIPALERPMWQFPFFSHSVRYGDVSPERHVGNSIIIIGDDTNLERFLTLGYPLIVPHKLPNPEQFGSLTVAWFIHAASMQEMEAEVRWAKDNLSEKPIIAYLDSRDWGTGFDLGDNTWLAIQAYRAGNESLDQFETAVQNIINTVVQYNKPLVLVSRFDDFNGSSTVNKCLECMPLYERWLRTYQFVGHAPFADKRGNGISANPSLWNWARAFQYAIPSTRPNRFDYWRPSGQSIKTILENKFGQSRAAIVMEPYLREDILSKYDENTDPPNGGNGNHEEPSIDLDLLQEMVENAWSKYGGAPGGGNPLRGAILNEAAYEYNRMVGAIDVGLSKKESGSNVEQPHTGEKIAHDIIQAKPAEGEVFSSMWDVFNDAGVIPPAEAEPHNNPDRPWLAPVQP
jgi:hypothetical protein